MFMKKITLIIILFISFLTLIFVYNDDFLYSKEVMKITNIKTIEEDTSSNMYGLEEKYYTKKITGVITNGKDKGSKREIEYEETYSSVVTDKYRVGDKVIIDGSDIDLKRDFYLTLMLVVFLILIFIVGSYKGLLSIASVILNMIISFFLIYHIQSFFQGATEDLKRNV